MNLYLKYQSPYTFSSKDIVQLKVYQNSDKIQGHKFKSLGTKRKISSLCIYILSINALSHLVQEIQSGLKNFKTRSQGQKSWYQKNGLFIMHLYLKYQRPNTFGSIDMALGKVFQNQVKVQNQGHKVKCFGTIEKASSQCISISSIKALVRMIQKIQPRLKFFKTRSKFKIKVTSLGTKRKVSL